ncbi:MAG: hypothetical protein CMO01_03395 [Thalassobius sp.]|nr:hypothetical protein [Thalassovita sp.]
MKTLGSVILLTFTFAFLSSHTPGDDYDNLKVKVLTEKPEVCNYKGLYLQKGLVKGAVSNAQVEVLVFLQQYNGHWMKKYYHRNGSGEIAMNMGDCRFTGNYHALAYYMTNKNSVTYKDIQHMHNKRGESPKFRVTKRLKEDDGNVKIMEGEVFTPNGETVDLTLFLEKKDGGWRKKHFTVFGSGIVKLDIEGGDLTGNYRSALNIKF